MYSPQVRESDIASVQNDEKYKFVIRCYGECQGTYEQTIDHHIKCIMKFNPKQTLLTFEYYNVVSIRSPRFRIW